MCSMCHRDTSKLKLWIWQIFCGCFHYYICLYTPCKMVMDWEILSEKRRREKVHIYRWLIKFAWGSFNQSFHSASIRIKLLIMSFSLFSLLLYHNKKTPLLLLKPNNVCLFPDSNGNALNFSLSLILYLCNSWLI